MPSAQQISAYDRPFTGRVRVGPPRPGRADRVRLGAAIFVYPAGARVCAQLRMRCPRRADRRGAALRRVQQGARPAHRHGCPSFARAEQIVREELARAGLRSWTIRRMPQVDGTAPRPCLAVAFKPARAS
jgi:hypothetical protein